MRILFEFHHDDGSSPDLIELRQPTAGTKQTFRQVKGGEIPADDILQMPYWVDDRFRESGLFRVGRIRNIRFTNDA